MSDRSLGEIKRHIDEDLGITLQNGYGEGHNLDNGLLGNRFRSPPGASSCPILD